MTIASDKWNDIVTRAIWPRDQGMDMRRVRMLMALGRVYGLRADMAFVQGLWARADEYNQRATKAFTEASDLLGPVSE